MTQSPITQVKPDVARRLEALIRELPPPPDVMHFTVRSHGCGPLFPARKPRKPTLASALKQAAKAGKSVKGAEVYPDRVVLQFGEPTPINANPWDEVLIDAADQKRPS